MITTNIGMNIVESSSGWTRSSWCKPGANCVEVNSGQAIGVRDSKNAAAGQLTFTRQQWGRFLGTMTV